MLFAHHERPVRHACSGSMATPGRWRRGLAAAAVLTCLAGQAAVADAPCPHSEDALRRLAGTYVTGLVGFGESLTDGSRPQALGFLISRALKDVQSGSETYACLRRIDAVLQSAFEEAGNAALNGYVAGSMGVPPPDDPFRGHDPVDLITAIEDMEDGAGTDPSAIATEWELVDLIFVADGRSYPSEVLPGALRLSLVADGSLVRSMVMDHGGEPVLTNGRWEMSPGADWLTIDVDGEDPDTFTIETLTEDRLVLVTESEVSVTRLVFERIPDD